MESTPAALASFASAFESLLATQPSRGRDRQRGDFSYSADQRAGNYGFRDNDRSMGRPRSAKLHRAYEKRARWA